MKDLINSLSRFFLHRAAGLLLIRIAVGVVFLMHGWGKVHNLPGTEGMFAHLGFGAATGDVIAWLELLGGASMIIGFLTRVFGVAFGIEMIVAFFTTGGFARGYQPHELELVLMLLSFGIALTGSGRYAIYPMECKDCGGMLCDEGEDCPKEMK